jgi:DNA-directed RNA polymerase subunit RPC12/RpoP
MGFRYSPSPLIILDSMKEVWENISGFEGVYKVSNLGSIISLDRIVKSNFKNTEYNKRVSGKLITPVNNGFGYLQVTLNKEGKKFKKYVHVLVAEAFLKKPSSDILLEVNHIDHIKINNMCSNLEWVSKSENLLKKGDYYGRVSYNCLDCKTKLSDNKAKRCKSCSFLNSRKVKNRPSKETIESLLRNKSFVEVGKLFNVSDNTIKSWLNGYSKDIS